MIILTFDVELNAEIAVFQIFAGFQSCTEKLIVIIIVRGMQRHQKFNLPIC